MKKKIIICLFLTAGMLAFAAGSSLSPVLVSAETESSLKQEILNKTEALERSKTKEAELSREITEKKEEVGALYAEIQQFEIEKQDYREQMTARIRYMYSNSRDSLLTYLLSSGSFSGILSRKEYFSAIEEYDRKKLQEYTDLINTLNNRQAELDYEVEALADLVAEQAELQILLQADITEDEAKLKELKEEAELKRREEEARREKEGSFSYVMSSSDGVLTKSKGVVYYAGHRETYYSQRVLPGGGLKIPGRHVNASDGTVRDADGYICVASSDLEMGTVVETSLGTGKVYDSGCASGTIDIYVDW